MNTDKYAKLNNEVDSLIAETNKKMHELIENYSSLSKKNHSGLVDFARFKKWNFILILLQLPHQLQ